MSAYVRGWMDVGVYCMYTGAGVWGRMSSVLIAFVRRWRIGGYCLVSYPDPTDISLMCNTMSSGCGNQEVVLWHTQFLRPIKLPYLRDIKELHSKY